MTSEAAVLFSNLTLFSTAWVGAVQACVRVVLSKHNPEVIDI